CSDGFEIGCDNGERVHVAGDTRSFARDIGLEPRTTPLESPQSNGMAEAFVRTIKRDYVRVSPRPDAETVMRQLPAWIAHYNEVHPHKALGYRSPREFIAAHATQCCSLGLTPVGAEETSQYGEIVFGVVKLDRLSVRPKTF